VGFGEELGLAVPVTGGDADHDSVGTGLGERGQVTGDLTA